MFIGEYHHNLDDKNRIIIPVKFREHLGDNFIVSKGLDGCLTIYTIKQWKKLLDEFSLLPKTKKDARIYIHMLTSKASECTLDKSGRIKLPATLVEDVKIEKDCAIIGVDDHVEIWSKSKWEEYYELGSKVFEEVAEKLSEFI